MKTLSFLLFLSISFSLLAQDEQLDEDLQRTFMPAIQMGYVQHATSELSGGLMIQTSVEYRDISNFVFRINYDDFNSNMDVSYPIDDDLSFTGSTTFSELIFGVGYRLEMKKHNLTAYVQPGYRFYGYPIFLQNGNELSLDFDSREVGLVRYSLGYEFALGPKLFLTLEAVLSHTTQAIDFWADNPWAYGATLGISAPLL